MKRTLSVLAATAILSACALSFDANSDFKKFTASILPKVEKAFNTKDVSYFKSISTADFSETRMGQTSR